MGLVAIHVGIGAWLGLEEYAPTGVMCVWLCHHNVLVLSAAFKNIWNLKCSLKFRLVPP